MTDLTLIIDGQKVVADRGMTIFEAAVRGGIYIPNLCTHPDLPPSGDCGLCLVEIEGQPEFAISCTTKVTEDMVIHTDTPEIRQKQHQVLEKILSEHPNACLTCWRKERCKPFDVCLRNVKVTERCVTCPENGRCELQKVADFLEIEMTTFRYKYRELPINRDNPFFDLDYNLCIACGRCVRACRDFRDIKALDFIELNGYRVAGPFQNNNYKDSGCKFCFTCVEVCPTGALCDREARYRAMPDWEGYVVPCRQACPAHIDVPRYIYLTAQGKYSEALAVIREKVPFPGTLGRVCIHPCEQACRRGQLNDPICIKFIKRFADDHDTGLWKRNSKIAPPTGKRVAVVGAGPAGLTAAYYLAKLGHIVTVFEALPQTGGMLRVGIPAYRLPRKILDDEIKEIENVGVEIRTNTRIESVDSLFEQGYDAVFLGLGAHKGTKMGAEGEDSPGVIDGVTFLRQVSLGEKVKVGKKIAIIGGGNAAVDCSRTALRLGAKEVIIIYRRTRDEMPAAPEEVEEALHEGVKITFLAAPNKVRVKNEHLELECLRMKLGEPDASGRRRPIPIEGSEFTSNFDNIIASIGQVPEIPSQLGVKLGRGDVIKTDTQTLGTSRAGVFAGGDVVTGPASVIEAIAQGRQAASSIDKYLGGSGTIDESLIPIEKVDPRIGGNGDFADLRKPTMPCLDIKQRLADFTEVELGYTEPTAIEEAKRCLRCDLRLQISSTILPPVKVKTA
jgi:NADPH-dependent glutamate synthase beta subunit-like oxidoreductase/formate hydrogenlyase subunit 6/NADH:ubiquinone oxidoreductase subunit I